MGVGITIHGRWPDGEEATSLLLCEECYKALLAFVKCSMSYEEYCERYERAMKWRQWQECDELAELYPQHMARMNAYL